MWVLKMSKDTFEVVASHEKAVPSIPFDESVLGATMRLTVINDTQYLSTRDIIMHVCCKNVNNGGEVWHNVTNERKKEVQELNFLFPEKEVQPSVLKEIEANALSESPVNHYALEALAQEGLQIEGTRKSKREELEILKAEPQRQSSAAPSSVMDKFASIINTYTALCLNRDVDDRAKTMLRRCSCEWMVFRPVGSILQAP